MRDLGVVLMTADTVGGVWGYSIELARGLAARGVRTVLATMGGEPSESQREEAEEVPGLTLRTSNFRLEWMDQPWDDVARAGEWLLGLAWEVRPDVVHLNGYCHGALPWPAPTVVVGHSCVLSWFRAVRRERAPREYQRYREEVARGLHAATRVVAPTLAMLDSLRRDYGPLPPTRVIANARDPERFLPGEKDRFVLAAGRLWDDAKNLRALERAAPSIKWPVAVAGPTDHPSASYEAGRRASPVHMLGLLPVRYLSAVYGRAPIYALPARYEPFGLSILEAALSGCALVLGDIESLRELWSGVADFVDPESPSDLARAINRLIDDPEHRERQSEAALRRGRTFAPERMVERYVSLYREARAAFSITRESHPCA